GGGKTALFYGILFILEHLIQHPIKGLESYPSKSVVMIVSPLVELANLYVCEIIALQ
ncbi:hypothetical protein F5I97DRAFT_1802806, partial [Phlebopus sp. FC_14]